MAAMRRLIVGLGNPDPQHKATRHNIGFEVLDLLVGQEAFRLDGRAQSLIARCRLRGRPVVMAKPLTYMNRSGIAVRHLMRRLSLSPECLLVVTDDLNLPPGTLRIRAQGSAGGHNGVQNIIDQLNTGAFARIRLGIRGPYPRGQQSRFVLSPFTDEERPVMEEALGLAAEVIATYVTDGISTAMNRFNRRIKPAKVSKKKSEPPADSPPPS